MKKILAVLLTLGVIVTTASCGKQPELSNDFSESESVSELPQPESELEPLQEEPMQMKKEIQTMETEQGSNILIAYFTWAENTYVENPDLVDVDATTSASVLMPGNVGLLAAWIQEETGGDMFPIITEEPYSSDYDTCLDRAIEEHDSDMRPAIVGHVENMQDYDVVFLGFPNWWYSCPMAILTFIEEHDLSGKTIVPFCSHGTGGFAASLQDIGKALPNDCTVLKEFGAYRPEVSGSRDKLLEWLSGLDISF